MLRTFAILFLLLFPGQLLAQNNTVAPSHLDARNQLIGFWEEKLASPYPLIRRSAAKNLASLKATSSIGRVITALNDTDARVRSSLVQTLSIIGNEQTKSTLEKVIKNDNDLNVRRRARDAIAQIDERLSLQEDKKDEKNKKLSADSDS